MKTRAFLFDMDGVIFLHPSSIEKLWVHILNLFAQFPILLTEFLSIFTGRINPKIWKILSEKDEKTIFGIVTDRTLLSTLIIFRLNKIPFESFEFIQTRASFLNKLTLLVLRPDKSPSLSQIQIWESEKKPNKSFLRKPRNYCFKEGVEPQNICMIDDQKDPRMAARKFGLRTATSLKFIHLD